MPFNGLSLAWWCRSLCGWERRSNRIDGRVVCYKNSQLCDHNLMDFLFFFFQPNQRSSTTMQIQMQQQQQQQQMQGNAQVCNFPVNITNQNREGAPPPLPNSLPPCNLSSNSVISSNNSSNISSGISQQQQQQPPMNLSFPRIPPSPDSALGGWSTPSSNLSRHNSDASQRSFSSSSNNTTPPSPSNSPLLSHNRVVNKCEDYGESSSFLLLTDFGLKNGIQICFWFFTDGDQQEVLLSSNFSSQGISRQQLINRWVNSSACLKR